MSNTAAKDLIFLSKRFKAILDFIPVLEQIQDVDRYAKETSKAQEALKKEIAKHKADLATLKGKTKELQEQSSQILKNTEVSKEKLLASASTQAQEILKQAEERAAATLLEAQEKVKEAEATLRDRISRLSVVNDEVEAQEKRFNDIKYQIARLRENL